MASAWGASWARAWGNAWGSVGTEPPVVDEREPPVQSGACFPLGSTAELIKPRRKKRRREREFFALFR